MENKFNEEDKAKVVEFLNSVAKHAKWDNLNTDELIKIFKLLAHMQQIVIPKLEANILEIKKIVEAPQEEKPQPKRRGRPKKS